MGGTKEYWDKRKINSQKAFDHHSEMLKKFNEETKNSVKHTVIYDADNAGMFTKNSPANRTYADPIVDNIDSVSACFEYENGKTAVLNFASYTLPGGMYMEGSMAQEEALCHASNLYEVLSNLPDYYEYNNSHKNKALYTNRGLYSPDVCFFNEFGNMKKYDVITVAAPNKTAYMQYINNATEEQNDQALKSRIHFIKQIALENDVETLILGAYGCGVFGQDPHLVAQCFKEEFDGSGISTVYAIIDKGSHEKEGNFAIFADTFAPADIEYEDDICIDPDEDWGEDNER